MKTTSAILLLLLAGLMLNAAEPPRSLTKDAMRSKLHFAQGVLEGITAENFSLIETNAHKLRQLSRAADWKIRSTREYERLTADYERATEALLRAVQNRSVDAATVAYFQVTTTCVTCHRYLRGGDIGQSGRRWMAGIVR